MIHVEYIGWRSWGRPKVYPQYPETKAALCIDFGRVTVAFRWLQVHRACPK